MYFRSSNLDACSYPLLVNYHTVDLLSDQFGLYAQYCDGCFLSARHILCEDNTGHDLVIICQFKDDLLNFDHFPIIDYLDYLVLTFVNMIKEKMIFSCFPFSKEAC